MRASLVLVFAVLTLAPATAEEPPKKWTLKLPCAPVAGTKFQETGQQTTTGNIKVTEEGKSPEESVQDQKLTFEVVTEITAVQDGRVTAAKWKFKKARVVDAGKETTPGIEAATVIAKKVEGKWVFTYEDDPKPDESDREAFLSLLAEDNSGLDAALIPAAPVGIGDSWNPEPSAILKCLGFPEEDFDVKASRASCKLASVETRDGAEYGLLTYEISLVTRLVPPVELRTAIPMVLKGEIKFCIDGTRPDGTNTFSLEINAKGPGNARSKGKMVPCDVDIHVNMVTTKTRATVK